MNECERLTNIADQLMLLEKPEQNGLCNSGMAYSIFFYWLSRRMKMKKYEEYADCMFASSYNGFDIEIFEAEQKMLEIVCGIDYLIQNNYCKGNLDVIFENFDIKVRNQLFEKKHTLKELSEIGVYFYIRYTTVGVCRSNNIEKRLRRGILQCLDNIDLSLKEHADLKEYSFADELCQFDINHMLFLCLGTLIGYYQLDIFNYRVCRIVQLILDVFSSCLENMDINNKAYLLYLLKLFERCSYVKMENGNITRQFIQELEHSTSFMEHLSFEDKQLSDITVYDNKLFFRIREILYKIIDCKQNPFMHE